ncbi:hypothetical protein [Streptomyces neyagawaensis]|uniref:Uncharacterized protein n=1 Tax=Streptomyces neyagawaensis TaxID=42238 RepID=A0ABV3B6D3_9ACTN
MPNEGGRLGAHAAPSEPEITRYLLGREAEAEFGAPYLQVPRADLHEALAAAVPARSVRLGTTAVAIDQDDGSEYVTTATGERLGADLVVPKPARYRTRPSTAGVAPHDCR